MNVEFSTFISSRALKVLTDLASEEGLPDQLQTIIHGAGSAIESIILVNFLLELEAELFAEFGAKIDLVDFLNSLSQPTTLNQFIKSLETKIKSR